MPRPNYKSVEEYLEDQPPATRAALEKVRATIKKALPRATEAISYQIPVFKVDGEMVCFMAGFPKHYSIYPATDHLLREMKEELAELLHGKATIRFDVEERVPVRLIARIAKVRAAEAATRKASKKTVKKTAKKKR